MPYIKHKCQSCGKDVETVKVTKLTDGEVRHYNCGHMKRVHGISLLSEEKYQIVSLDNKTPYPFQIEAVKQAEASGIRCLFAHEMGLGKTIMSLLTLKLHPECLPVIIVCKSAVKYNWMKEILRWCGEDFLPQVIDSGKDTILPLKVFIVSYDLLPRLNGILDKVNAKTIILDEVQQIKNMEAKRTKETLRMVGNIEHVMALSGTPIKNHAAEYFPVLNCLNPEMFPSYNRFIWNECDTYYNGYSNKTGGLLFPERFMEKTKGFIFRKTREEVLPDLPKINRTFKFTDLSKQVEEAYKQEYKKFQDYYNSGVGQSFEFFQNILAYLTRMRHLVGVAKVEFCVDFVDEFLTSTDRKITIFVHHKDVGMLLDKKLQKTCELLGCAHPLMYTSDLTSEQRDDIVVKFTNDANSRILIASTLAGGEGINLQVCSDAIILERQWNPANEEQAEARFPRPGSTASVVDITYITSIGTVDEFLSELVERKRSICNSTMSGKAIPWDESSVIKELAEILAQKGGKKWGW